MGTAIDIAGPVQIANFSVAVNPTTHEVNPITLSSNGGSITLRGAINAYSGTAGDYAFAMATKLYGGVPDGVAVSAIGNDILVNYNTPGNYLFFAQNVYPTPGTCLSRWRGSGGGANGLASGGGGVVVVYMTRPRPRPAHLSLVAPPTALPSEAAGAAETVHWTTVPLGRTAPMEAIQALAAIGSAAAAAAEPAQYLHIPLTLRTGIMAMATAIQSPGEAIWPVVVVVVAPATTRKQLLLRFRRHSWIGSLRSSGTSR